MNCVQEPIIIYRGESLEMELDIFTPEMRVQKLTDASQITVTFNDQDGNYLSKNLTSGVTIVDAAAGQIKVSLSTGDTSILPEGEKQTFGAYIEFTTGDKRNVEFERVLTVKKRTGGP